MTSLRSRQKSTNTLVCLLQGLRGRKTTIELRNENSVHGQVDFVDAWMNTFLTNATFRTLDGTLTKFEHFYVQGKNIRYVHIPDDVDMLALIKDQLRGTLGVRKRMERKKRLTKEEQKKQQKAKRKKKLEEKLAKTMAMIEAYGLGKVDMETENCDEIKDND